MGKKNTIFIVGAIVLLLAVVNSATQPPLSRLAAEKQEATKSATSKSSTSKSTTSKSTTSKSAASKSKATSKPSSSKSKSSKSSSSSSSKGYSDAYKSDASYRKNVKDIADAYGTTQKEIDDTIRRIVENKNKR